MKTYYGMVLIAVWLLAGCDRFDAALSTPADKINAAFPLSVELQLAQAKLMEAIADQPKAQKLAKEQISQLLQVRALVCAGTARIGRFDVVAEIKAKLKDAECFKKQDADLTQWIGVQRMGVALGQPALRPFRPLPPKAILQGADNASTMVAASDANVSVIKSNSGRFTAIDLSSGNPIHSFQSPGEVYRAASLSPNGRLLAVPISNRAVAVYEVESGAVIWSSDKHSDVTAWLPGVQGLVLSESGTSKAVMLDLVRGRFELYMPSERSLNWSLDLPGGSYRKVVGSSNAVSVVEHSRGVDGSLVFTPSAQWRLTRGISAQAPWLMNNGKLLVFLSHPDLGWLDIETGDQGTWGTSAVHASGFSKLDELQLLYTESKRGQQPMRKLFNVQTREVFSVRDIGATEGHTLSFAPRAGHAKAVNGALVIHTAVQAENPRPLDQLISQAQLEEQLAKLNPPPEPFVPTQYTVAEIADAVALSKAADAAVRAGEGLSRTDRNAYLDLVARQVRAANVVAGMRDGLSREVIERIRAGTNHTASTTLAGSVKPGSHAMLTDVPADAEVAVIGVYQGRQVQGRPLSTSSPSSRQSGSVNVTISGGGAPLVLVLSSYESVHWNVQNTGGRKIAAILLSSYHDSRVVGAANVKTLKIGSQCAYKLSSPQYNLLKTEIGRYVVNPVRSFQGSYEAADFSVRN